jgi:glycosyltransferase involved in cell wall biosynthesis
MTVTVYTIAWGDYWEKFGKRWTDHILNLNRKPDEIIIISDKHLETNFKVIVNKEPPAAWRFRNCAIKNASSSWLVPIDLDDNPLPNFIDNLNPEVDIHSFSLITSNGKIWNPSIENWNDINNHDSINPIPSCSAVKLDVLKNIKYRNVGWEDWALWIDLKNNNALIYFDSTVRYVHNNTENSYGKFNKKSRKLEINKLKEIYK